MSGIIFGAVIVTAFTILSCFFSETEVSAGKKGGEIQFNQLIFHQ